MEFVNVIENNIDKEHICCAISDKKGENCVKAKKNWLKDRLKEGLVFYKLDVRGKVFIEYIPAEYCWYPFDANEWMVINCLWVSGRYKGQGISNLLLEECIKDSKEKKKKGIVVLSSKKKMPYLSDGDYLKYRGFKVADNAHPNYELLYFSFNDNYNVPKIKQCAKNGEIEYKGLKIYYTNQCPYTEEYINKIKVIAEDRGIELMVEKYTSKEQAQSAPSPYTTYSVFFNGKFVTNDIFNENKFIKFLDENNL